MVNAIQRTPEWGTKKNALENEYNFSEFWFCSQSRLDALKLSAICINAVCHLEAYMVSVYLDVKTSILQFSKLYLI